MSIYVTNTPIEKRRAECERILMRHPLLIPVIIEAARKHTKVSFTALPAKTTAHELQDVTRAVSGIPKNVSIALFISGCVPSAETVLADLYEHCKAADGFLYVTYTSETSLGATAKVSCLAPQKDSEAPPANR